MTKDKLLRRYESTCVIKIGPNGSASISHPIIEVWRCSDTYYARPKARAFLLHDDGTEQLIPTYEPHYEDGKLDDTLFWEPSPKAVTFWFKDKSVKECLEAVAREYDRRAKNARRKANEQLMRAEEYDKIARDVQDEKERQS